MFSMSQIHVPVPWELQRRARCEPWVRVGAASPAYSPADLADTARRQAPVPSLYLAGNLLLQWLQDSTKNKQLEEQIGALVSKLHQAEKQAMRAKHTASLVGRMASHSLQQMAHAQEKFRLAEIRVSREEERARQAEDRACRAKERARIAEERATAMEESLRVAEERARRAEEKATIAKGREKQAEERARQVEEEATIAKGKQAKERARQAEEKATIAKGREKQAEERARRAEEEATIAKGREKHAEEKARMLKNKYLDAASEIQVLKMELALAKRKKDATGSRLQDRQGVVTASFSGVSPSPSLPGCTPNQAAASAPPNTPSRPTSHGSVGIAGHPAPSTSPVSNSPSLVHTPHTSKPSSSSKTSASPTPRPTIAPSPVGATSLAAAHSSTAMRAPSLRGAAGSSSCSSYVWTISDLKTFDPSRGSIVLGKGSYGTVYLCRHRVTNQPIAVKTFTLPSCVQQMTKKVAEIQEEAALLDLFGREECFPTYLGCLEIGTGCVGLAMEFIGDAMTGETVTLHEAIRGAVPAITRSNWLRLALDICRGLELIHQRGYLMNDLKEDNVLLDKSSSGRWRARVIDLGMVSRQSSSSPYYFSSEEKARYLRGELYQHIAPEVAIQDQATDVLSDVYQILRSILTEEMFSMSQIHVPVPWELQRRARCEPWVRAGAASPAYSPADLADTARRQAPVPPLYLAGNLLLQWLQDSTKNKQLEEQMAALVSKLHQAEKQAMRAKHTASLVGRMASHSLQQMGHAQEKSRLAEIRVSREEERARQAEDRACRAKERARIAEEWATAMEESLRVAEERARRAEEKATIAKGRQKQAEERARQAEEEAAIANGREKQAEERARQAEEKATIAKGREKQAEERARQAEEEATIAKGREKQAEERARRTEEEATIAKGREKQAEERARRTEEEATIAKGREKQAEERARQAEEKATIAKGREKQAEERARQAEEKATIAKGREKQAEERARQAEEEATIAKGREKQAEERARQAEEEATIAKGREKQAEERARQAEEEATIAKGREKQAEERARQAEEEATIAKGREKQAEERARRAEEEATIATGREKQAEEKARMLKNKYLDAASEIQVLKMELALAKRKKDATGSRLQDRQGVVTASSSGVSPSPSLPGCTPNQAAASAPPNTPSRPTSHGSVGIAGHPAPSTSPVSNSPSLVHTPHTSKPSSSSKTSASPTPRPTIAPSPVGATSLAAAHSSTAMRAPSPRGAAASSSCTSSYVWTISDLKTFDPSRGSIVLGKGSYGTVYLCRHRVTNQPIAVKTFTLPSCVQQMTKKVAEIQEEAALLDLFGREECFPTYFGCLEIGTGCVGLAMEFIGDAMTGETVTLHEAIRGAVPAITRSNWLRLALDICRGLELIHQRGYLMNDLKEDNVLLDKSSSGRWRARVIDLGMVSRQSSSSPYYFTSEEKARYLRGELYQHIAPEVAIQDQATDVLSDVYQVGRLMNMMGRAAGDGRLTLIGALCRNVCRASRPAVRDVVQELERMI
ncbi:uncharacterized protein [Diadema setosum]